MPADHTALDRFIALKLEIDQRLADLTRASADHFGVAPDAVTWGHVGSLNNVTERLREACRHLGLERGDQPFGISSAAPSIAA